MLLNIPSFYLAASEIIDILTAVKMPATTLLLHVHILCLRKSRTRRRVICTNDILKVSYGIDTYNGLSGRGARFSVDTATVATTMISGTPER